MAGSGVGGDAGARVMGDGTLSIVVASRNPVKVRAAEEGFARVFPGVTIEARGVEVASGVADQPMSDEETLRGATNRAVNARAAAPDARYWVGLEGGVHEYAGELEAFAWIVVLSDDRVGRSRTATFALPPAVAELVRQGVELGHADDRVFGRSNSKQTNGAVGLLTRNLIDRAGYYEHAVVLALVPFVNPSLFPGARAK
jgi:inosine/xanthosine triphosphatase